MQKHVCPCDYANKKNWARHIDKCQKYKEKLFYKLADELKIKIDTKKNSDDADEIIRLKKQNSELQDKVAELTKIIEKIHGNTGCATSLPSELTLIEENHDFLGLLNLSETSKILYSRDWKSFVEWCRKEEKSKTNPNSLVQFLNFIKELKNEKGGPRFGLGTQRVIIKRLISILKANFPSYNKPRIHFPKYSSKLKANINLRKIKIKDVELRIMMQIMLRGGVRVQYFSLMEKEGLNIHEKTVIGKETKNGCRTIIDLTDKELTFLMEKKEKNKKFLFFDNIGGNRAKKLGNKVRYVMMKNIGERGDYSVGSHCLRTKYGKKRLVLAKKYAVEELKRHWGHSSTATTNLYLRSHR